MLGELVGFGLADMTRTQQFPVVVRTEVDYKRPALLGDKLVVKGSSIRRADAFLVRIRDHPPVNGALLVKARQMLAVIQMPEGKPVRLSKEWEAKFGSLRS